MSDRPTNNPPAKKPRLGTNLEDFAQAVAEESRSADMAVDDQSDAQPSQQASNIGDALSDSFDALPRDVRIQILRGFAAEEVDEVLCRLNKKYRYIYCGYLGDAVLSTTISDKEVVYEHWLFYLERDFGVSRVAERCRGYTAFERRMVQRALEQAVPIQNRLNAYMAQAYKSIYKQLAKLQEARVKGISVLASQDHIVFIGKKETTADGERRSWVEIITTVDLAYAAISNTVPTGYTVLESVTTDISGRFAVKVTGVHGGVYAVYSFLTRTATIVHFYEDVICVSIPIQMGADISHRNLNVAADPFLPTKAYALIEIDDRREQYCITSSKRADKENVIRLNCLVEKVNTSGIYANLSTFKFDSFSLSIKRTQVQITARGKPTVSIPMVNTDIDFGVGIHFFVPITASTSDGQTSLRIVEVMDIGTDAKVLCIDCMPGTAYPVKATYYVLDEIFDDQYFRVQINDGQTLRFQTHTFDTENVPKISATLDLETGEFERGTSSTGYDFTSDAVVSILSRRERLVPLSANARALARQNALQQPQITNLSLLI
jgi:hypothetical protein